MTQLAPSSASATPPFHSLRVRLLLPLLAVAVVAALSVAVASYWRGNQWSSAQIALRYDGIARTLSRAPFPLNRQVIQTLAELSNTELVTLRASGAVSESSLDLPPDVTAASFSLTDPPLANTIRIDDQPYRYGLFSRRELATAGDDANRVVVLFDESELRAARIRAAGLPLATGLSTVFLLSSVALVLASRLIGRLSRLGQQVDAIAEGNFDTKVPIGVNDEIGVLGSAVDRMAGQLRQMWRQLSRTQGERLLHQIAGGLAHQLRNGLTGARMAVELHRGRCPLTDDESLQVAISQMEQTEDYVHRLLLVVAGKQETDHPESVLQCLHDVQASTDPRAKHLRVEVCWEVASQLAGYQVSDGPSLSAAVSNLLINAMQAGQHVEVTASKTDDDRLQVIVQDDGPGPPAEVTEDLFEPFVTSKPEGLGLGLPLVSRAAERLGGKVEWRREAKQTRFVFQAKLLPRTDKEVS